MIKHYIQLHLNIFKIDLHKDTDFVDSSIIIIRNIVYALILSFYAFISITHEYAELIIVYHARVPRNAPLTKQFFFRIPERYTLLLINIKLPVGRDRVTSTRGFSSAPHGNCQTRTNTVRVHRLLVSCRRRTHPYVLVVLPSYLLHLPRLSPPFSPFALIVPSSVHAFRAICILLWFEDCAL